MLVRASERLCAWTALPLLWGHRMHQLTSLLSVCLSLVLFACTSRENLDCAICEAPEEALVEREGRAYLINRVTFGRAGVSAAGLDIDGRDSGFGEDGPTCENFSEDFASSLDPRITGVDNNGQDLIVTGEQLDGDQTFQGELDAAVTEGRIRWAIAIGEAVDDGAFSTVRVTLHVIDADQAIETFGGVPVADQSLSSRAVASFDLSVAGDVAFGEVAVSGGELDAGDVFLLPFDDFSLRGIGLDASVGPDRLVGVLGGSFSVDALLDVTLRTAPGTDEIRDTLRTIFVGVADLQPSAEDPSVCERVSVGFGFEAVPVVLN